MAYNHKKIEKKWQDYWQDNKIFRADDYSEKPKYYVLDMFPYPSGAGLHVGHPLGYIATDIVARYKRHKGYNVLHPMGWDAFGLPAEQYAIKTGTHPSVTTKNNIKNFRRQINMLGFSYDWDREINTTDTNYVKWTQWIFLQLYKKGLAYEAKVPVNWCPELKAVLANEEVVDGKSEIGGHPVIRVPMRQWMLKITKYADSLLDGLDNLDWPNSVKELQRNWIGRSTGANVQFHIPSINKKLSVFTTRPDTLFGATYMVMAPEHPWVKDLVTNDHKSAVRKYIDIASKKSDLDRTDLNKEKTGVYLGANAINPVNGKEIPIWISDYVIMSYGTGAIMAVPGQDQRDWDFAKEFDLPIIRTVETPSDFVGEAYIGDGVAINSDFLNGLDINDANTKIISWLENKELGEKAIQYKLRDWLFSRQRYWGEPIPIIHKDGKTIPLDETELPLELPNVEKYEPSGTGESPLSTIPEWVEVKDNSGAIIGLRETNTMPQWAGSCWYYLRYLDPTNDERFVDEKVERYWMSDDDGGVGGVDLYVGGVEHAVLHLLYSRFWHKVLFDLGHVSGPEPFQRLFNQGYIQAAAFQDSRGVYVEAEEVEENDGVHTFEGQQVTRLFGKMGKSLKNSVTPDDMYAAYGADTLRLYEMFMGPLDQDRPWETKSVVGSHRLLQRVWRNLVDESSGDLRVADVDPDEDLKRLMHRTIESVGDAMAELRFNSAIARITELNNELTRSNEPVPREVADSLVRLLSPLTPHVAEELWELLGQKTSVVKASFPVADKNFLVEDSIEIPIQINGKVRSRLTVAADTDATALEAMALADEKIAALVNGKTIRKVISIPGRMVNLVVS